MTSQPLRTPFGILLNEIRSTESLEEFAKDRNVHLLLEKFRNVDAFSYALKDDFSFEISNRSVSLLRQLKTAYSLPTILFITLVRRLAESMKLTNLEKWETLEYVAAYQEDGRLQVARLLKKYSDSSSIRNHIDTLDSVDPHAIFPTSSYRSSEGKVESNHDSSHIEAVMSTHTFTEIHISEGVLALENPLLKDVYKPLGRVVSVVDSNVCLYYEQEIKDYFDFHNIELKLLVYRAMEVDKGIHTVESLLGDFKKLGVNRQEPVLIIGGGVITDIGGLACALYHRNTPYVMLSTSIVSGIDAGPSPRTCCDGFGFKNLFGAYHAPVMTITDRTFFKTLKTGWIRHGIAEIIKMAVVKDYELFELLENTGIELLRTRFGAETEDERLKENGHRVLCLAMKSYITSEYNNLYETHQCRPHAYGHTWSPGFEIPSGMLHGHAISCGMGFGAFLSFKNNWLTRNQMQRILNLISNFELSLWHSVLEDSELIYQAQIKVIEKRGGNLVAPLPKKDIGKCGYLNQLSKEQLENSLKEYRAVCQSYTRQGIGIEPLCADVGLEDPSTIAQVLTGQT